VFISAHRPEISDRGDKSMMAAASDSHSLLAGLSMASPLSETIETFEEKLTRRSASFDEVEGKPSQQFDRLMASFVIDRSTRAPKIAARHEILPIERLFLIKLCIWY
jgi:hypothetical protein